MTHIEEISNWNSWDGLRFELFIRQHLVMQRLFYFLRWKFWWRKCDWTTNWYEQNNIKSSIKHSSVSCCCKAVDHKLKVDHLCDWANYDFKWLKLVPLPGKGNALGFVALRWSSSFHNNLRENLGYWSDLSINDVINSQENDNLWRAITTPF